MLLIERLVSILSVFEIGFGYALISNVSPVSIVPVESVAPSKK